MPADDEIEARDGRVHVHLLNIMQDVYQRRPSLGDGRHRQPRRPGALVYISAYGNHRSHGTQLFNDLRLSNVAGMDDQIAALQGDQCFFAQQAVGIRNESGNLGVAHSLILQTDETPAGLSRLLVITLTGRPWLLETPKNWISVKNQGYVHAFIKQYEVEYTY